MNQPKWLLLAALIACGGSRPPAYNGTVGPGDTVSIADLIVGITGGAAVTWSVAPGGGTVSAAGLYTAPSCTQLVAALPAGTVLANTGQITATDAVTATWVGGTIPISINVAEAVLTVTVTPADAGVLPGGTVQFHAHIGFTCHTQDT